MTREGIIELAKQCGLWSEYAGTIDRIEAFFHAAQALEREECAVIAEDEPEIQCADGQYRCTPSGIAAAIRNRN